MTNGSPEAVDAGKMLYAEHQGMTFLKLVGDIRFHECAALDRFLQNIVTLSPRPHVVFDLFDASMLDSTALGVIAQLAVHSRRANDRRPSILCRDPDMLAVLRAVSFDRVFSIHHDAVHEPQGSYRALDAAPADESEFAQQVLAAHRHLANLSQQNRSLFASITQLLDRTAAPQA